MSQEVKVPTKICPSCLLRINANLSQCSTIGCPSKRRGVIQNLGATVGHQLHFAFHALTEGDSNGGTN